MVGTGNLQSEALNESRKTPDKLAKSAQEEMQKHPKWNQGKGWKNTFNNLLLFIQPLCYFNLLKPWLVVIFTPQILRVFCCSFFQLSKLKNSLLEMIFPQIFVEGRSRGW